MEVCVHSKSDMTTMSHLSLHDLMNLDKNQRVNLVHAAGGFKSACLIGSVNPQGQTNLAIFNSLVHLGSTPPLFGFIVRPNTVEGNTLRNIMETGYYTINHMNKSIMEQGHQTSARYPKDVSEFTEVGLHIAYQHGFIAPYVEESHVQIGLEYKERIDLSINGTILIIGQIQHLYFPESCLEYDGFLDLEKAGSLVSSGLDSYHATESLGRLAYAKPGQATRYLQKP